MIWIEILSRHKEVVSRSRHSDDGNIMLTIGRGYDNDVIVDDAHVAAQHLRLRRDERGAWFVEDLGSKNGLYDNAGHRHTQLALTSDTLFRIGNTWVRLRPASHLVAAERRLAPPQRWWPWLLGLFIFVFSSTLLEMWLNETGEPRLSMYLMPIVSAMLIWVIWTTVWAGLSRLLSGTANFVRHAVIALSGLAATTLFGIFAQWGTFAFSCRFLSDYTFAFYWLILAAACLCHLRAISAQHLRLKTSIVTIFCVAAITVQWLVKDPFSMQQGDGIGNPYLKDLWPPAMRVIDPQTPEDFFRNVEKIKTNLDELRKKEPEEEGFLDRFIGEDEAP